MRFSRGNSAPHAPRSRISSGVGREDTKPSTKPVPSAKSRGREKKLQGKGIISKARARKAVDSAAAKLGSRAPAVAGSGATPKMQLSKLSLSKSAASPSRSAARDIIAAAASPRLSPSRRPGSPRSPGSPTSPAVQSKSETLEQEPSGTEGDGVEYDDINPFAGLVRVKFTAVLLRWSGTNAKRNPSLNVFLVFGENTVPCCRPSKCGCAMLLSSGDPNDQKRRQE